MMRRRYLPVLLMSVALYLPSSVGAAQSGKNPSKNAVAKDQPVGWMLAGREGACAPLSVLAKRGSEFRDVESPEQLAKKMRAAGHKVEVKEHQLASRPAVEVRVPDRGLYIMFVKANLCAKIETPPTK